MKNVVQIFRISLYKLDSTKEDILIFGRVTTDGAPAMVVPQWLAESPQMVLPQWLAASPQMVRPQWLAAFIDINKVGDKKKSEDLNLCIISYILGRASKLAFFYISFFFF